VLASSLLSFDRILPFAVFGTFAIGVWWLLEVLSGQKNRAAERLSELSNPASRRREDTLKGKKGDAMSKVLEMATPTFSKPLQPKTALEQSQLKAKLSAAGFRGDSAAGSFLGLKLIGLMVGLLFFGSGMIAFSGMSQKTLIYTVFGAGTLFYLPDFVVGYISYRRKKRIFLSLPDALDLLVVCVEAGLGLDQAMRKVSEEMKRSARVLCEELSLSNFQLQMGRPKAEVLHELGTRTGVEDLRCLAAILIQADKFGSSVAQALRVQSDSMRTRRRQLAEEKAAKTAVKLIFPLVIFIFPGIFVVLVGPAAITMIREMFPAMNGH
jgi:tight adherence protein C